MAEESLVTITIAITAESTDWLAEFTRGVIADRVAACGNIIPAVRSIYAREDKIEDDIEALALIHTRASSVDEIIRRTSAEHPTTRPRSWPCPSSRHTTATANGSLPKPAHELLVGELDQEETSGDGLPRHPSFRGIHTDKTPDEVGLFT
ncbi:divalent cation tolerance protein CutA [Nocardia cyriacigeorgica]|uniref:divalent cation tolerance protein CutA n=1 Tax=Nocardia cyriacigeorgica TaxID=135487 RepID=UPI002115184E|nr:divalent cation tolerance protein CutA [Nocardia cyriacigeorgica]